MSIKMRLFGDSEALSGMKTREKFQLQTDSDLRGGDIGFGRSQTPIEHEKIGQKHSKGGRG